MKPILYNVENQNFEESIFRTTIEKWYGFYDLIPKGTEYYDESGSVKNSVFSIKAKPYSLLIEHDNKTFLFVRSLGPLPASYTDKWPYFMDMLGNVMFFNFKTMGDGIKVPRDAFEKDKTYLIGISDVELNYNTLIGIVIEDCEILSIREVPQTKEWKY